MDLELSTSDVIATIAVISTSITAMVSTVISTKAATKMAKQTNELTARITLGPKRLDYYLQFKHMYDLYETEKDVIKNDFKKYEDVTINYSMLTLTNKPNLYEFAKTDIEHSNLLLKKYNMLELINASEFLGMDNKKLIKFNDFQKAYIDLVWCVCHAYKQEHDNLTKTTYNEIVKKIKTVNSIFKKITKDDIEELKKHIKLNP